MEEIGARFGRSSELRQVQLESLRWLIEASRRAPIVRIVIDGSFTTDRIDPNDVDCIVLLDPSASPETLGELEAIEDLPFLHVLLLDESAFQHVIEFFQADRRNIPKGLVEVTSWN